MKTIIVPLIVFAALGAAVAAQEQGERRGGGERGPRGPERMLERVAEDLALDAEQRALWDEIVAGQRAQMDQWRTQMRELRQARRDGDEARAAELEAQVANDAWNPMEAMQQSLEQLEATLKDDQRQRYSEMTERWRQRREAFEARGAEGGRGWGGPDRMLQRMAETLELNAEQHAALEEIAGRHRERIEAVEPVGRELRRAQRDGDAKRAEKLRAQLQQLGVDPEESLGQAMDEVESILDEQQGERFSQMRRGMEQRAQSRDFYRAAEYELPGVLNMDQAQRAQYDEYLRGYRQDQRGQWEQVRSIRREMREASEAGDEARLEELNLELEMTQRDPLDQRSEFLDGLKGILREDQWPALHGFYPTFAASAAPRPHDVRDILRAALRTGLDKEQRAAWRVIMRGAMKSIHEIRGKDKDAEAAVSAQTREKIEALLTEAQRMRFEKELKRERRGKR